MSFERAEQRQERGPELEKFRLNPLRRTAAENRERVPTREGERAAAKRLAEGHKLVAGLDTDPGDDPMRQEAKNNVTNMSLKNLKDAKTSALEKNCKEVQTEINNTRITPLLQRWNSVFLPDDPKDLDSRSLKEYRTAFGDPIKGMLTQAGKGIVMITGGRVCNRVGYAAGWMRELDKMLHSPLLRSSATENPALKEHIGRVRGYITEVHRFFKGVLDGDPAWTQAMQLLKPERKKSADIEQGKMAMKMLCILVALGMTLISGLIDIKNGKLSFYTIAWLGIAGYLGGAFKGRHAAIADQLKFMTNAKWEALGINGDTGARLTNRIKSNSKSSGMLKQIKAGKATPEQYIQMLVGDDPQGEDALTAQKPREVAAKGTNTFIYMMEKILAVTDPTAKVLFKDFQKSGINSRTVAADARKALPAQGTA